MATDGALRARTWTSFGPDATEALGEALGRALSGRAIVALAGDLGAGKTCFVRGLARGLDVRDAISSPTYALLQTYAGREELHHLDAWMEGRERAFLLDGGLEWVSSNGVVAIEWADRLADVLPAPRLAVTLTHAGQDARRIRIEVVAAAPSEVAPPGVLEHALAGIRALPGLEEIRDR